MTARERAAAALLTRVEERRAYLQELLNKTFFSRFTVATARRTVVSTKGRTALEYAFRVNVYSRTENAPSASVLFSLEATNKAVLDDVRRELVRCGLD